MTFLTPLLLLGLAAVAIPILLHLLRRREKRTLVFPALRYLKRSTREHARIVRLRQLLLLALRVLAVLLIALAGARLVLPMGGSDDPPAGVALVIDNGLTSGAVVGGGRVLDSLTARARDVLDRAGPRDQIWIVPAGAPARPSVPLSPERAPAALEALGPTHVTSSLSAALERAGSLLDASATELREIILVSDLRPETLESMELSGQPRTERVVIAPPPEVGFANRGIGELLISGGLTPRAGEAGEIQVTVVGAETSGATVRAYVGERLVGTATTSADGTAVLPLPRVPVGWIEGRVEVEPDDLRGDDVMHFALLAIPPPSVQLLSPVAPFLEEALSVLDEAGRIRLTEVGDALVQVISGRAETEPSASSTIIIVPPDEAALVPSLNQELGRILPGWSLEPEQVPAGAELSVGGGPLLDLLPSRPRVRQLYTIRTDASEIDGEELLTLSDGRPWIVESGSPERSVIVLTSPMSLDASDLSSSAAMLPLVELLVTRVADAIGNTYVLAGEPFQTPQGSTMVRLPDGTGRPVLGDGSFRETELTGVYRVLGEDQQPLALVAVNSMSPSSATGLTADEAVLRLSERWAEASAGEPWPQSVLRSRRGREVARPLLFVLLLLLVAESWLASAGLRTPVRPDAATAEPVA